jgi:DNA-binding transcriptional LysR family regulator
MDLRRVQVFVTAANSPTFTQAAKRLHLSQSAVSQQIRLLEGEVGEVLFSRDSRAPRLSAAGERLLPLAQEVLNAWDLFRDRTKNRDEVVGKLVVGASAASMVYLWSELLHEFGRQYPRVTLDLQTESTEGAIQHVLSGDLDIAIAVTARNQSRTQARVVGVHEALLCVAAGNRLAARRAATAADLAQERFLLFKRPVSIRWLSDEFFEREELKPNVVLESSDVYVIRAMIEIGFGIGFLPDWCIQRELKEGRLVALQLRGPALKQEFGVIYNARSLSAAARAFLEFCESHQHLLPVTARIQAYSKQGWR